MGCRKSRMDSWLLRLRHESSFFDGQVSFVTLTYREEDLPYVSSVSDSGLDNSCSVPSLCKKDYQDFFKRLRKVLSPKKIKYFIAGEYGAMTRRPHYHAIIFGCTDVSIISQAWNRGYVKVLPARNESFRYVAKYIQKDVTPREQLLRYKAVGIEPPFIRQSTGLGKLHAIANSERYKASLLVRQGSKRYPLPRYYRKVLGITEDDYVDVIHDARERQFCYFLERYGFTPGKISTYDGSFNIELHPPYMRYWRDSLNLKSNELLILHKHPKMLRLR